jgi:hypothetical protein
MTGYDSGKRFRGEKLHLHCVEHNNSFCDEQTGEKTNKQEQTRTKYKV